VLPAFGDSHQIDVLAALGVTLFKLLTGSVGMLSEVAHSGIDHATKP
jgi:hypothetical protein